MSTTPANNNAIDKEIANFHILGERFDANDHRIGAELLLDVPPIGKFVMNVVTKKNYAEDYVQETLDLDIAKLTNLVYGDPESELEKKEPYVLNDDVITDEVLDDKFRGRIVKPDLLSSMWFAGSENA